MLINRSLKQLSNYISSKSYDQAEAKLVDLSNSLVITYFIPNESKFKQELLPTILQRVLPITYNEQLNLRFQAESFLTHWYSLLSSFSPVYLLGVYQKIQTTTLQPAAQASLLTFLTNALHYISPELRAEYLGTCHSLLLSSQPEFLSHLTQSDWQLLADTFSLQIIPSIVKFLLNSPLTVAVVTFLKEDPETILPIILAGSNLQFLKEIIPLIPSSIYINLSLLKDKLFNAIRSQNSSDISGAIEIITLLVNRPRHQEDRENWKEIFQEVSNLWTKTSVLTHKAAIIDLFSNAAKFSLIPISTLHKFMYFDSSTPTVISTAIIKSASFFVKYEKKIPHGLPEFLYNNAIEKDPLLFVATIEFLVECFNEFYQIAPRWAEKILDVCINPLPQYFVEQNAVIRLLKTIDWNVFPEQNLRINILDIIMNFIDKPHPSVVPEVQALINESNHKIILPYTKLDWYEKAPSYLTLLPNCDPLFIMELLDFGLLSSASYPIAIDAIVNELTPKDNHVAKKLFKRALFVIIEALKILKIDYHSSSSLKKSATKEWSSFSKGLGELFAMINDNLQNTAFGKIVDSSLLLLSVTTNYVKMSVNRASDLIEIAKIFGTAFTINSCKVVQSVFKNFKDVKISMQIYSFFTKIFPYDHSEYVSLFGIECLPKYQGSSISAYINVAANSNREVLKKLGPKTGKFNTFLALKNDPDKKAMVETSIKEIPFEKWQIEEEDFEFIGTLKDIHVKDLTFLDEIHKKVVQNYPSAFIIDNETKYDTSFILEEIPETVSLDHEIPSTFEGDLNENNFESLVREVDISSLSIYKVIESNTATLTSFLWFSKRAVTDDDFSKIEQFAINRAFYASKTLKYSLPKNDISLSDSYSFSAFSQEANQEFLNGSNRNNYKTVLSFLAYASRMNLMQKIDLDKWLKIFVIDRNNNQSIISFLLLTTCIRKKWNELSQDELNFITNSMADLGIHDLSEFNLVKLFKESHGFIRMAIEGVISIDPTRFQPEDFPFFADIFLGPENFEKRFDSIVNYLLDFASNPELNTDDTTVFQFYYEAVSIFSKYLYPSPQLSLSENFDFPRKVSILEKYFPSNIAAEPFQIVPIPPLNTSLDNNDDTNKEIEETGNGELNKPLDTKPSEGNTISQDPEDNNTVVPNKDNENNEDAKTKDNENNEDAQTKDDVSLSNGTSQNNINSNNTKEQEIKAKRINHVIESLFKLFEKSRAFDEFMFSLIFHFEINAEQYQRLVSQIKYMRSSSPFMCHLVVKELSKIDPGTTIAITIQDDSKTPSYTRQLISLLSSPNCPKLHSKEIHSVCSKLKPVLFDLLFKGFDSLDDRVYDKFYSPGLLSSLYLNNVSSSVIVNIKLRACVIDSYGAECAKQLFHLDDKAICTYFNTVSPDAAKVDLFEKLMAALITQKCYLSNSIKYIKMIMKNIPLSQIQSGLTRDYNLNGPHFTNIYLMTHIFEKQLEQSEDDLAKDKWAESRSSILEKIKNKDRAELLFNPDLPNSFIKLLSME